MKYSELSDKDLESEVHNLALRVSYYNAAEGNWSQEAKARGEANREFQEARNELLARGLPFVNKGYLL